MLFIIIIIFSMPESGVLQDSIFFKPERGCYSLYTITSLQHQKVESFHKKWCCLSDSMSVLCHLLKSAISCLTTFSFTVRSWDSGSNFHQHKYRAEMPADFIFYIIAKFQQNYGQHRNFTYQSASFLWCRRPRRRPEPWTGPDV